MQWAACTIRRGGHDLLLIAVYFRDGLGCTGGNLDLMEVVGEFVHSKRLPFLMLGDFNMLPEDLNSHGWVRWLGGEIVTPRSHSHAHLVWDAFWTTQWSVDSWSLCWRCCQTWMDLGRRMWAFGWCSDGQGSASTSQS